MQVKSNSIIKLELEEVWTPTQAKQVVEVEVLPPVDITDKRRVKIYNEITEIDKKLSVISERIEELNAEIDSLTNHADGLDYAVAIASGILTGLIDSFFVGETNLDIDSVRKELEEKYHTSNDSAFQQKTTGKDGSQKNVSSPSLHRLEDMAHHPTLLGLVASIFARFFRLAIFSDGNGKTRVFFIDKHTNPEKHKKEMTDMYISLSLAVLAGLMSWLANMAKNKYEEEAGEELPEALKKIIRTIAATPAIIDIMLSVDAWLGHIMSDVSTNAGVPGVFLSLLKHLSMLPILNKTGLPHFVQTLYENKTLNISEKAGVVFLALKKQSMPILINEVLVRGFYFVRRLILEYKEHENFIDINWNNVIPFGNRTVERMMTIASGTFVAVDVADAAIRSGGFNAACILRINFVGIGRFAIAIGTDIAMGIKKHNKEVERSAALSEYINLANIKIYYREADLLCTMADLYETEASMYAAEKDIWKAVENTQEAMEQLYAQIITTCQFYVQAINKMDEYSEEMVAALPKFDNDYPGLRAKLLERLK